MKSELIMVLFLFKLMNMCLFFFILVRVFFVVKLSFSSFQVLEHQNLFGWTQIVNTHTHTQLFLFLLYKTNVTFSPKNPSFFVHVFFVFVFLFQFRLIQFGFVLWIFINIRVRSHVVWREKRSISRKDV